MSQIGSFGEYEVPIFEKADVTSPYLHIDGEGYLALDPLSEMQKPTYVVHINGNKYAVSKQVLAEIDYFNDTNTDTWSTTGDSDRWQFSSAAAKGGAYGLELLQGSEWTHWTDSQGNKEYYPKPNKNHQFWFKIDSDADDLWKFYTEWAGDGQNHHAYEDNIYHTGIGFQIQDPKYDDSDGENYDDGEWMPAGETPIDWNRDQWYMLDHRWEDNGDGTDTVELKLYTLNSNNERVHVADNGPVTFDNQKRGDWLQINWGPGAHIYFDQWGREQ